jgi:hypothetical protein
MDDFYFRQTTPPPHGQSEDSSHDQMGYLPEAQTEYSFYAHQMEYLSQPQVAENSHPPQYSPYPSDSHPYRTEMTDVLVSRVSFV